MCFRQPPRPYHRKKHFISQSIPHSFLLYHTPPQPRRPALAAACAEAAAAVGDAAGFRDWTLERVGGVARVGEIVVRGPEENPTGKHQRFVS